MPSPDPATWHKRYHPLRRQWVVYAAHRNTRPWSFDVDRPAPQALPPYAPDCYLCPRNRRVSGIVNPDYTGVYVFANDHPVVGAEAPPVSAAHGLYQVARAGGEAGVICYHPRHDATMANVAPAVVRAVLAAFRDLTRRFLADPEVDSLLIFENRGALVGVSNPHPHCQYYALDFPLGLVTTYVAAVAEHHRSTGENLFDAILDAELADGRRLIASNRHAVAFVPFFARWAYEVMVMPRRRHATLATLSEDELSDLAAVYQEVVRRYDGLFGEPFPYVMSVLQAPLDGEPHDGFHAHLLLQPPLRQPGLQKYLAGPETGADTFMADTLPEERAAELRAVDLTAYPDLA